MVKKTKAPTTVNSLTALIDGLNVKEEPPKDDSVDSLLGKIKKLKVTPGKKVFKKSRKSGSKVSSSTGRVKMDVSNTGKFKKIKVRLPRRKRSTRNADETLSSALDKLALGTKKKEKEDVPKVRKRKEEKDVLKQKETNHIISNTL